MFLSGGSVDLRILDTAFLPRGTTTWLRGAREGNTAGTLGSAYELDSPSFIPARFARVGSPDEDVLLIHVASAILNLHRGLRPTPCLFPAGCVSLAVAFFQLAPRGDKTTLPTLLLAVVQLDRHTFWKCL